MKISAPAGPLEPNKAGKINVSIDTFNMHDNYKYKKNIEVVTNDPDKKEMTLIVQATIHEALSFTPQWINYGQVKAGSNYMQELTLANNSKKPIVFSQISLTSNPEGRLSLSNNKTFTLKPGEKKRLILKFSPGNNIGMMDGTIFFKTDMDVAPERNISVHAEVIPGQ